uniref:Uncharacterized protein n=1 Tax=Setaria italica TaxID=4555 RepID=K3XTR9_SETIT
MGRCGLQRQRRIGTSNGHVTVGLNGHKQQWHIGDGKLKLMA